MAAGFIIRQAQPADAKAWLTLWRSYCAALDGTVDDTITQGVWRRIVMPEEATWCLLACLVGGEPIGFANYILHPHTWSLRPVCYLEDLFVAPEERGSGAGRLLIEQLVSLGKQHGWRRIYWHTHKENHRAHALYDRITSRTDYVRYDIEV